MLAFLNFENAIRLPGQNAKESIKIPVNMLHMQELVQIKLQPLLPGLDNYQAMAQSQTKDK